MKRIILPIPILSLACLEAPDRPLSRPAAPSPYASASASVEPVAYTACIAADAECGESMACCDGAFCSTELFAYGPGTCTRPQPDGSFCVEDTHCASGHCVLGACRGEGCGASGSTCADGFPCCEGLTCDLVGYTEGVCVPPYENGHFCVDPAQCASGSCIDNVCADPSCRAEGIECYDDLSACCPGLFCEWDRNAYGLAYCTRPLPAGSFCLDLAQCASGICTDNVCQ
jgi:hypothetical protein